MFEYIVKLIACNWVTGFLVSIVLSFGSILYIIARLKGDWDKIDKVLTKVTEGVEMTKKDIIPIALRMFIWEFCIPMNAPELFTKMSIALHEQEKSP